MILLSHYINEDIPSYGNRDRFMLEEISLISKGATANSSKWIFTTNHIGTHIDMPKHFFDKADSITDVPINFWFSNKVQLLDVPCKEAVLIDVDSINEKIFNETEVLLIKTGYENFRGIDKYWNDNPGISPNFGSWLRKNWPNIKIIGFDFISLTSWKYRQQGKKAHQIFLAPYGVGKPICIIEDMSLYKVNSKIKSIIVSPLFVRNTNGGPVTVFAQV